jgi:hypothetical protein
MKIAPYGENELWTIKQGRQEDLFPRFVFKENIMNKMIQFSFQLVAHWLTWNFLFFFALSLTWWKVTFPVLC